MYICGQERRANYNIISPRRLVSFRMCIILISPPPPRYLRFNIARVFVQYRWIWLLPVRYDNVQGEFQLAALSESNNFQHSIVGAFFKTIIMILSYCKTRTAFLINCISIFISFMIYLLFSEWSNIIFLFPYYYTVIILNVLSSIFSCIKIEFQ